ncbi:TetR/AcrR family transcriptional regulator [Streptomyces sp. NPDC002588]|uniref:TetR/AcrR family transcriptional regulator n=1 Tax=Streptomyces sp. NPDC002588 TaxID=3154419 RepID=UPI0033319C3E
MTETESARTPRERYRAQVRTEVKERAWEQIATAGASALSLNAIAKKMGMSGPALYRYFASRDELITELIRDAYRSLADTFHAAAGPGSDLGVLARALREWALADPHRYLLVYGTPIPGYRAPRDTAETASEIMAVLLEALPVPEPPARALPRALSFWTRLHGVLSLELAGHFTGMDVDPAQLFGTEVRSLLSP